MLKLGTKVKVHHDTNPFTGELECSMKWENPLDPIKKKGITYFVRADDDGKLYSCDEELVTKLTNK